MMPTQQGPLTVIFDRITILSGTVLMCMSPFAFAPLTSEAMPNETRYLLRLLGLIGVALIVRWLWRPLQQLTGRLSSKAEGRQIFPAVGVLTREYPLVIQLSVAAIVAVAAGPSAPAWTRAWIGAYLSFVLLRWLLLKTMLQLPEDPAVRLIHQKFRYVLYGVSLRRLVSDGHERVLRSMVLSSLLAIFLRGLYMNTPYLGNIEDDTLWLLFILPVTQVGMSRRVRLRHFAAAFVVAIACLILSQWPTRFETLVLRPETLVLKVFWLGILCFGWYTLVRFMSVWWEGVLLLDRFTAAANSRIVASEAGPTMQNLVERLRDTLGLSRVLLLIAEKDPDYDALVCVAGAGDRVDFLLGRRIAYDQHFVSVHPGHRGVYAHVLDTGHSYVSNDTASDPYFVPIERLPAAKAELVQPILVEGRVIGLLAASSLQANTFWRIHQAVFRIAAALLGQVIAANQTERYVEILAREANVVIRKLMRAGGPVDVLRQVSSLAVQVYGARYAVVYGRESRTGTFFGPYEAGIDRGSISGHLPGIIAPPGSPLHTALTLSSDVVTVLHESGAISVSDLPGARGGNLNLDSLTLAVIRIEGDGTILGLAFVWFASHLAHSVRQRLTDFASVAAEAYLFTRRPTANVDSDLDSIESGRRLPLRRASEP